MNELPGYRGKFIRIIYFQSGKEHEKRGELEEVRQFSNLKLSDGNSLPFLGTGVGIKEIQEIETGETKTIYWNPFVENSYNWSECEDVRKKSGFPVK